jgi:hypothetical protein
MTDRVKDLEAKLVAMKARDAAKLELQAEAKTLAAELRTMRAKERAAEIDRKVEALTVPALRRYFRSFYEGAGNAPAFATYALDGKQRTATEVVDRFADVLNKSGLMRALGLLPSRGNGAA